MPLSSFTFTPRQTQVLTAALLPFVVSQSRTRTRRRLRPMTTGKSAYSGTSRPASRISSSRKLRICSDRVSPFIRATMWAWSRNSSETRAPTYASPSEDASDVAMWNSRTGTRLELPDGGDADHRGTVATVIVLACTTVQRMPGQGDGYGAEIKGRIPTNHKSAVEDLAWQRSTKHERYPVSEVLRDALKEYLARHSDELSEEARDDLDDDLLANAGGSE